MSFNLDFPNQEDSIQTLQLNCGEMIFVLGVNGSGKSSLMYHYNIQNYPNARKISAHRQTWMNSDALDMTPSAKLETEKFIQNQDRQQSSRFRDIYAAQRASMTIYELIDAQNVRARDMAEAYDAGDMDQLAELAKVDAPIAVVNELLQQSNIPITISIRANERVMASKNNGPEYSAAELSDGERNALMIASNVLTAPPGTLLVIDEPERHLHRSIISPLLGQLFERRSDCGFVISTHDYGLPIENPHAQILLLRSCSFDGQNVKNWEADLITVSTSIDDAVKRDLIGARRDILFVEGTESSLDKPLYSLVFPMVSVIPKANHYEVEQAVIGARSTESLHWLRAFGIADGDGLDTNQIEIKQQRGVYALPYYSVESIYFHPYLIRKIATRQATVSGDNGEELAESAIVSGVEAIKDHTNRLSLKAAKKLIRRAVMDQIPNDDGLLTGEDIVVRNCSKAIHLERKKELDIAVANVQWDVIVSLCPVHESDALETISRKLGFRKLHEYHKAVRHLITQDEEALQFIRSLFKDLNSKLLD